MQDLCSMACAKNRLNRACSMHAKTYSLELWCGEFQIFTLKRLDLHFMMQFLLKSVIPMKSGNPQPRVCQVHIPIESDNSLLFFQNSCFLSRHKVFEVLL